MWFGSKKLTSRNQGENWEELDISEISQVNKKRYQILGRSGSAILIPLESVDGDYLEYLGEKAKNWLQEQPFLLVDAGSFFANSAYIVPYVQSYILPKVLILDPVRLPFFEFKQRADRLTSNTSEIIPKLELDYKQAQELIYLFSDRYAYASLLLTDHCNLKCKMCMFHSCDTGYQFRAQRRKDRKPQELNKDTWRSYLEQLPHTKPILFSSSGEVLCSKFALDYMRQAIERDHPVTLGTNGLLLDGEIAEKLLDLGVKEVTFSIDGHKKHIYEAIRIGANFDLVVKNLHRLRKMRDARGSDMSITINSILFSELINDKSEIAQFWKDRADSITFLTERKDYLAKPSYMFIEPPCDTRACFLFLEGPILLTNGLIAPCCHIAISEWFEHMDWLKSIENTTLHDALIEYRMMILEPDSPLSHVCARCHFWCNSYQRQGKTPYNDFPI